MSDPWLTVPEAAAQLKSHPRFVYNVIKAGTLPHVRLGKARGMLRIRQSALDAWADAQGMTKPA